MVSIIALHYRGLRRPSLGVVATNLYTADVSLIEKVIQKVPSICNGVLVEKVCYTTYISCFFPLMDVLLKI